MNDIATCVGMFLISWVLYSSATLSLRRRDMLDLVQTIRLLTLAIMTASLAVIAVSIGSRWLW